jgi:hypothetical protein
VAIESARLWGHPYLLATDINGSRHRLDSGGGAQPLLESDWLRIAKTLGAATAIAPQLIATGDTYYYSRAGAPQSFPVRRLILNDRYGTRYYLDPVSGMPLAVIDGNARWYRWLHRGLHTLDFSAAMRSRPLWDLVMLALLAGVTILCGTGTWLGWRRYIRIRPQ